MATWDARTRRSRWSRWSLVGALAALAAAPGSAAAATQTFTSNGTFTVPAGVNAVSVDGQGAAGGDNGDAEDAPPGMGGAGGEAAGTIPVTPGETLSVLVGVKGADNTDPSGGAGGAGGGGNGGDAAGSAGAGGGGRSEVDRGSTQLVVAGGGGGGVFNELQFADGGDGGGLTGGSAFPFPGNSPAGGGGTQTAGGKGGDIPDMTSIAGQAGNKDQGGAGGGDISGAFFGGGGGGGGYFGGGGGPGAMPADTEVGLYDSGGGGSGHLDPSVSAAMLKTGVNRGAGIVTITYSEPATSTATVVGGTSSGGATSSTPATITPPPAALPLAPSSTFAFARVRLGVHQLRLGFDYPVRGKLDVLVTTRTPGASAARQMRVGRLHDSAVGPETHTLRVPLTHRGQSMLGDRGKLPIRLTLVFTPDGGQPSQRLGTYTMRSRYDSPSAAVPPSLEISPQTYHCPPPAELATCWGVLSGSGLKSNALWTVSVSGTPDSIEGVPTNGEIDSVYLFLACQRGVTASASATTAAGTPIASSTVSVPAACAG